MMTMNKPQNVGKSFVGGVLNPKGHYQKQFYKEVIYRVACDIRTRVKNEKRIAELKKK